ncbi:hypothetical protein RFI_18330 [Reticulomyxa filosa]|uniref:Uncharacterized protein n=1 Tax=Reticulomyxa filosa TaxID=46433 RepID=X6N0S8_RETFI|nr:hypothetical protein RFI_18330 [Reticulomyxa filosa]|eukprot:ETO18912.1 hypothetical protein RFI_18330 [Reticulomyxa filosa]
MELQRESTNWYFDISSHLEYLRECVLNDVSYSKEEYVETVQQVTIHDVNAARDHILNVLRCSKHCDFRMACLFMGNVTKPEIENLSESMMKHFFALPTTVLFKNNDNRSWKELLDQFPRSFVLPTEKHYLLPDSKSTSTAITRNRCLSPSKVNPRTPLTGFWLCKHRCVQLSNQHILRYQMISFNPEETNNGVELLFQIRTPLDAYSRFLLALLIGVTLLCSEKN